MATTLERTLRKVRQYLDAARNPDTSRKFAKVINANIFVDEANGNRVGIVGAETFDDEFGNSYELAIVIKEEEVTDSLASDRVAAALVAFDLRTGT